MRVALFMRSAAGRAMQVVAGIAMIWFGAAEVSLIGLCLMMFGVLPIVAGISNEFTFDSRRSHTP